MEMSESRGKIIIFTRSVLERGSLLKKKEITAIGVGPQGSPKNNID